jgi:hypothetical protein
MTILSRIRAELRTLSTLLDRFGASRRDAEFLPPASEASPFQYGKDDPHTTGAGGASLNVGDER